MRFHHFAIEVNNMEESVAFYKKLPGSSGRMPNVFHGGRDCVSGFGGF